MDRNGSGGGWEGELIGDGTLSHAPISPSAVVLDGGVVGTTGDGETKALDGVKGEWRGRGHGEILAKHQLGHPPQGLLERFCPLKPTSFSEIAPLPWTEPVVWRGVASSVTRSTSRPGEKGTKPMLDARFIRFWGATGIELRVCPIVEMRTEYRPLYYPVYPVAVWLCGCGLGFP